MKNQRSLVASGAVLFMLTASGQAGAQCDESSAVPPTGFGDCTMTSFENKVRHYKIEDVETSTTKGSWHTHGARNCAWVMCSQEPALVDRPIAAIETRSHCWEISGSVSVEGKTGLLVSLCGILGVTVEVEGKWTGCKTTSEERGLLISQTYCFDQHARENLTTEKVTGKVLEHEKVFYWVCDRLDDNGNTIRAVGVPTYCGTVESDGSAKKFATASQYAPSETCGVPIPPDDQWDGKRATPCCHPMPPCDEVPNGTNPCCGCYGEH